MILGNIKLIVKRLREAMAIVEEGDTASQSIAKDKYVMWKGTLCKTDSAITQGGTFATSGAGKNLTAKTEGLGGEIATLNSNIVNLLKVKTETITSDGNGFFDTSLKSDEAQIIDVISISNNSGPYKVSILKHAGPNTDINSLQFLEWNNTVIFKSTTKTITFIYIDLPTS